jgi:hypothetical protein
LIVLTSPSRTGPGQMPGGRIPLRQAPCRSPPAVAFAEATPSRIPRAFMSSLRSETNSQAAWQAARWDVRQPTLPGDLSMRSLGARSGTFASDPPRASKRSQLGGTPAPAPRAKFRTSRFISAFWNPGALL